MLSSIVVQYNTNKCSWPVNFRDLDTNILRFQLREFAAWTHTRTRYPYPSPCNMEGKKVFIFLWVTACILFYITRGLGSGLYPGPQSQRIWSHCMIKNCADSKIYNVRFVQQRSINLLRHKKRKPKYTADNQIYKKQGRTSNTAPLNGYIESKFDYKQRLLNGFT